MPTRLVRRKSPKRVRVPECEHQRLAEEFWRSQPASGSFRAKSLGEPVGWSAWEVVENALRHMPTWVKVRFVREALQADGGL